MRLGAPALLLCLSTILASSLAHAQQVDAATRSTARQLGTEGLALYEKGSYELALEKFRVANQLVPAPTLGVRAARCLEKLGRLVEASEAYLDVTRQELDRTAPWVHRKAQAEALTEREKLLPRIPTLLVSVTGPVGDGVTVLVDDDEMPAAMIGQKRAIDPGEHEVVARRGAERFARQVSVVEKGAASVTIDLPPLPLPPPKEPVASDTRRILGWVFVGVGAAGVVVGLSHGAIAAAQESSLLERCGDARVCPPDASGDVRFHDVTRAASTIGLVLGAVGLAAGVPLLLTAPPAPDEPAAPSVSLVLSPASASVTGRF